MSAPLKSTDPVRRRLKNFFVNGAVPDEAAFAEVIDLMALRSEVPPPAPPVPPLPPVPADPRPGPQDALVGRFDPAFTPPLAEIDSKALRPRCWAPADGAWHPVLQGLQHCHAFEIVGCASGQPSTGWHAVTHALALTSMNGRASLRQTFSAGAPGSRRWWLPRCLRRYDREHRIELRWSRVGQGHDLYIRTTCNFGLTEDGQQVRAEYHITRLW